MEPIAAALSPESHKSDGAVLECLQFGEDIRQLINVPPESAGSFTALLELPVTQAMEILQSPDSVDSSAAVSGDGVLCLPSNMALIEPAAKFSVFAGENNSSEISSPLSNMSANAEKVKNEPMETDSDPTLLNPPVENMSQRWAKRKEREKKGKGSSKKNKNESSEAAEKLPYVHVRARRGQATDSHSLAERARREKINARMKLLQELVPGCNKISGTALMLDEIINHVQSLQRQVEFLSMRLAAVDPRIDFNLENILAAEFLSMRLAAVNPRIDFSLENIMSVENGSLMDSNFPNTVMPPTWPEFQANRNKQQYEQQWHFDALQQPLWEREEDNHNFLAPENSLVSYDSTDSASIHSNLLKMEL